MKEIPTNSLLASYLPADYADSFSRTVTCKKEITPGEFRNLALINRPNGLIG